MNNLVHADIFFFITTCAVVAITIILVFVLIYVVLVAKNIHYVIKKIKEESDHISEDIAHARMKIKEQGTKIASLMGFLKNMASFKSSNVIKDFVRGNKKSSGNRKKSQNSEGEATE